MTLLIVNMGLPPYFRQRILNAPRGVAKEGFNISKAPEPPERFSESCVSNDVMCRISRKFVLSPVVFWFTYYAC